MIFISLFSLLLPLEADVHSIDGRLTKNLYQIDIPIGWERSPIDISDDTRRPIALFIKSTIKIEIHNFPGLQISPKSQIDRWQKKIENNHFCKTIPQSFSGFRGLFIESKGLMGWALEMPKIDQGEKSSPVTIKITGNEGELISYRKELIEAARSFELQEPL